jgi:hypothetical protein
MRPRLIVATMIAGAVLLIASVQGCGGTDEGDCGPTEELECGPTLGGDWGCWCRSIDAEASDST